MYLQLFQLIPSLSMKKKQKIKQAQTPTLLGNKVAPAPTSPLDAPHTKSRKAKISQRNLQKARINNPQNTVVGTLPTVTVISEEPVPDTERELIKDKSLIEEIQ